MYFVPGYDSLQLRMSFMRLHGDFFDEAGKKSGVRVCYRFFKNAVTCIASSTGYRPVFLNLCETAARKFFFYKTRARSQQIYS